MDPESKHNGDSHQKTFQALEVSIRLALAFGLVIWCFQILRPFLATIVWALVISSALFPVFKWLKDKVGTRPGISATLFTSLTLVALMTPIVMLSGTLVGSAKEYATDLQSGTLKIPAPSDSVKEWPVVGENVHSTWALAHENMDELLSRFEQPIKEGGRWLIESAAGAGLGILQFAVAMLIAGVFLAYSDKGEHFADRLGKRLAGEQGAAFTHQASATIRSVAQGVLGVAFIQSFLAGIGYLAIGIPGAGLWALLTLIMSIAQFPTLVIIPTIFYVISTADPVPAAIYTIYAVLVAITDNLLKPLLLGRGSQAPMPVIFLGAIGGFILSGIVGLFVGAVVLVLGYQLFMSWLYMDAPELKP
ncbi:AI-2E family transporter [Aestuariirhabdus sp. Z084]|uniref:AI-2E family transporter n=1 Tax=Aestuariirhabdus haliotis TaxID=2918751 RepID=UPI00201B40FA|nr:AI-2E family transporter [Aestuariirhabdus haliotis]MCL6415958.1 AI-2E family transporter [Aestuariirhabdus haliotis]MCL6420009.1 AI-2E family transporter [Aestuariirhabdus haliotis]